MQHRSRLGPPSVLVSGAIAALLTVAACTAGAPQPTSTISPTASMATTSATPAPVSGIAPLSVVPCDNYVDHDPPPSTMTVVGGMVALPAAPTHPALQTGPSGDTTDPGQRLFAKTGLIVKRGQLIAIEVPAADRSRLAIGWGGGPAVPARLVRLDCPPEPGQSSWYSYVGGYWLPKPACLPLIVRVGTHQEIVHVGLGTPCPGQKGPQGPSVD